MKDKERMAWNRPPTIVTGKTAKQTAAFLRSAKTGKHDFLDGAYERMAQALDLWPKRQVAVTMGEVKSPDRIKWGTLVAGYGGNAEAPKSLGEEPPLLTVFSIVDVATEVEVIRLTTDLTTNRAKVSIQGPFKNKGAS